MHKQTRIQEKLVELLKCLEDVDLLINCHVANFFTKNLWQSALPENVAGELKSLSNLHEFPSAYLRFIEDQHHQSTILNNSPALSEFLMTSNQIVSQTEGVITSEAELDTLLNNSKPISVIIRDFMSAKKKHEIEKTGPLVDRVCRATGSEYVIDIGGGKGYLSAILARHSALNILSLDASAITTQSAANLEKKIKKHMRSSPSRGSGGACCRETVYVTADLDVRPLLVKHFFEASQQGKFGLLGLHTCGNLATTCCRIFVEQKAQWLINVGCCYHLIDEQFDASPYWADLQAGQQKGFPASRFLISKEQKLGINARMLAAHSLQKLTKNGISEKSTMSLFYRAVLQVLVERVRGHSLQEGNVGRLFEKCTDFHDYVCKASEKLKLNIEISHAEITKLLSSHAEEAIDLRVFFLLRIHFAPLIELVILLDRLLYLLENGIENAHLVPLFSAALSPRNHALIAWR